MVLTVRPVRRARSPMVYAVCCVSPSFMDSTLLSPLAGDSSPGARGQDLGDDVPGLRDDQGNREAIKRSTRASSMSSSSACIFVRAMVREYARCVRGGGTD